MPRPSRFALFVLVCLSVLSCFLLGYYACANLHLTSNPLSPAIPEKAAALTAKPNTANSQPQLAAAYGRLPLYFIANRGQMDKRVQYYVKGGGQTTFFTKDEVVLALARLGKAAEDHTNDGVEKGLRPVPTKRGRPVYPALHRKPKTENQKLSIVRIKPVGLHKSVTITALDQTGHRVNYFLGKDPKKWHTDIPTYQAVVYENAYAGIDLKFYGQGRQLEYDIVVKPGADPNQVRFAYQGIKKLEVTPAGDLALVLPDGGRLLQKKPVVYQEVAGARVPVDGKFRLCGKGAQVTCGFAVAAYDKKRPLVIDPVLEYSTYLGGNGYETGRAIAVDGTGAAYVTGQTGSSNFPFYQGIGGGQDEVFITKLSPAGNSLVYSIYLGGSGMDYGRGIAVDQAGAAYITGYTESADFPTHQACQGSFGGGDWDVFVCKINSAGNALFYPTYVGGSGSDIVGGYNTDYGNGIALDSAGAAYVTGETDSGDFPTQQAYQEIFGGDWDAFVFKVSPSGNALIYSTYLGGSSLDYGRGIAVDKTGAAYVTGETWGDFPIRQAYQEAFGGNYDAFVTKLSPAGNDLIYSTYLGGSDWDEGNGIAVDPTGAAYVTGMARSEDFPVHQAWQKSNAGKSDVFVTKLSPAGNTLAYSTYLGGSDWDFGRGIAVDAAGAAYVTGAARSGDFPTHQAVQGAKGDSGYYYDAFVTKLSPSGNALVYSTYLGGESDDNGLGIAVDRTGAAYVTGVTYSENFPSRNAFQGAKSAFTDAFITKLGELVVQPPFLLLLEGE